MKFNPKAILDTSQIEDARPRGKGVSPGPGRGPTASPRARTPKPTNTSLSRPAPRKNQQDRVARSVKPKRKAVKKKK